MELRLKVGRLVSDLAIVLGALLVPFFLGVVLELEYPSGTILMVVLWIVATIGLGVRFGTWRALFLAVIPVLPIPLLTRYLHDDPSYWLLTATMVTLIWLVGIAVGVLMRKFVFGHSQWFP